MFKHWMKIVHNHDNGYLDWLFYNKAFPLRESSSMSSNGIGSHVRNYLEVDSLSSDQVFLSAQLKIFQNSVDGL